MIKVLVVKLSSLGDVLHALPAVSDAAAAMAGQLQVDWLVEEAYRPVPAWHAAVSEVITIGLRRWRSEMNWQVLGEFMEYIGNLRAREYDVVIDAQGLAKSAFLGALPARGIRHGLAKNSARESIAAMCYEQVHTVPKQMHAVARIRRLFAQTLGYPESDADPDYGIKEQFTGVVQREAVTFVPNCARPVKLWVEHEWAQLGKIIRANGWAVEVTWGNDDERQRAQRIADVCQATVTPPMDLAATAKFLAGAKAMVSLDTGLAHLGAACAVPNVCLCVATDPDLSGAMGEHQLCCANAGTLDAAAVWDKLQGLLSADKAKKKDLSND